ncbi:flagellar biosynthetic protein FliR [Rhodoblastus sp.]|uniref:flagellar biosynthetic protein FliR n=1 Tax=Rhodoblastus sp. TaxID=1962975 RepID=UPI0026158381|nr:flagellar biosynthetic protein FliR [Rhodoblastus sp.]
MSFLSADMIATVFVLFCRIGACLMLAPGFSSPRAPARVRLFIALVLTLALTPSLSSGAAVAFPNLGALTGAILSELGIGGVIGLLGRFYFLALETLMMAVSMNIGLSNALGAPIDETEPLPPIATLITTTATALIFVTDLHWELIRGLISSYRIMPIGFLLRPQAALHMLVGDLSSAFVVALRVASPFIVFAIAVNLAIGLINRLTPQIPVFFISGPFVVAGGLILFYFISGSMVSAFLSAFGDWALRGD